MSEHYIKDIGKVEYVGHEGSVTMGTYNIEEIEKSNENKVEIIWKQSQQIEKLKDKLQKQAEWIENNKNKAKNCAMQMQNQGKEIQRLKQSNKDLMAVIWKTKNERAKKGREVCKANNEVLQYQKQIRLLNEKHNQEKIDLLKNIKDYFCIECKDDDGIKTGDWGIVKDACDVANYIDTKLAELTHQQDKGE